MKHEEIQSIKKILFYRNMQRPSSKAIPDMRGKWTTTATIFTRRSPDEPPNFDNIQTVSFPTEIEQKDHFLIIKEIGVTRMGVLNYQNQTWTLTVSDDDDNGSSVLFPKCPRNYNVWVGSYTESGFSDIPEQAQVVARAELRRD